MTLATQPEVAKPDQSVRMKLSAAVSSRVDIDQVVLLSADLRRSSTGGSGACDVTTSVDINSRLDEEKSRIAIRINFHLVATSEIAATKQEEAVRIDASFLLTYKLSSIDGLEEKHITAFGELNGMFNAWPYWREFVQSITSRMGLPPITVPSLKVLAEKTPVEKQKPVSGN